MPRVVSRDGIDQAYVDLMEGAGMVYNAYLKRWEDPDPEHNYRKIKHPKDKGCYKAPKCLDCTLTICEEDRTREHPDCHKSKNT